MLKSCIMILFFLPSFLFAQTIDISPLDDTIPETRTKNAPQVDPEYTRQQLQDKWETFDHLRSKGKGLLISGVVLEVVGVSCLAVGATIMDQGDVEGLPVFLVGYVGTLVGIPLTITGGVLTGIGNKKSKEYQLRLERVSLGITSHSIAMIYDF